MDDELNAAGATGTTGGARGVPGPAPARGTTHTATRSTRARGPWRDVPTGVLAAVTLVLAFAAAQGTGVRALGGVVLVVGVVWCAWRSLPAAGVPRVAAVVALGAVCFVASHLLAPHLGAWPSVVLVGAVLGTGAWLLVDRRPASG